MNMESHRPQGTWTEWGDVEKINAVRWLGAHPQRMSEAIAVFGMPDRAFWPFFARGLWWMPSIHMEIRYKTVHSEVERMGPMEILNPDVSPESQNHQVYLEGVPSFMTKEEVTEAIERKFKVRELKLNAGGGFALVELLNEADVPELLVLGYIKIGDKMVECKKYRK